MNAPTMAEAPEIQRRAMRLQQAMTRAAEAARAAAQASASGDAFATLQRVRKSLDEATARLHEVEALDRRAATYAAVLERLTDPEGHAIGQGNPSSTFAFLLELTATHGRLSVEEAARRALKSRRALLRWMRRENSPRPSKVLAWGAVVRAMYAYALDRRDLWAAASLGGFSDPFSLSNVMFRETGLRPSEWRAAGADFLALADAMAETWRAEREEADPC